MPGYIPGKIKNSSEIARRTAYLVPAKPYAFVRFVAPPIRLEGEGRKKRKEDFLETYPYTIVILKIKARILFYVRN